MHRRDQRGAPTVNTQVAHHLQSLLGRAKSFPMQHVLSEEWLRAAVFSLVRVVEAAGAVIIFCGAALGFVRFIRLLFAHKPVHFTPVRLDVGRFLALGLEFQLASDLLSTAVAPSFEEIGKLAAVAAIRTALNFFLGREIRAEREEIASAQSQAARP
jgi:uncharacterized membrane protein